MSQQDENAATIFWVCLVGVALIGLIYLYKSSSEPEPKEPEFVLPPFNFNSRVAQPASPNTRPSPVITQDSSSQNSSRDAERLNKQTEGIKALGERINDERKTLNDQWKKDHEAKVEEKQLEKKRLEKKLLEQQAEQRRELQRQRDKELERKRLERRP